MIMRLHPIKILNANRFLLEIGRDRVQAPFIAGIILSRTMLHIFVVPTLRTYELAKRLRIPFVDSCGPLSTGPVLRRRSVTDGKLSRYNRFGLQLGVMAVGLDNNKTSGSHILPQTSPLRKLTEPNQASLIERLAVQQSGNYPLFDRLIDTSYLASTTSALPMDSFNTEITNISIPKEQEKGGGGGTTWYCIIA
ncbi:hypothetical protein BJ165DRAFT_1407182 [Panaeolus papilionaceus]|nr:hypothetical protein BJ165DRAFT_1407182 [Panaeolus papilionaceus]